MIDEKTRRIAVIDHAGSASSWTRAALATLAAGSILAVPFGYEPGPRQLRRRLARSEPQRSLPPPPAQDTRDDKYLHASARRRRRKALLAQCDGSPAGGETAQAGSIRKDDSTARVAGAPEHPAPSQSGEGQTPRASGIPVNGGGEQ